MTSKKVEFEQEYLSPQQCAALTGESPWTWRKRAYEGRIASVKLGRSLRISHAEVRRLVAEGTRPAVKQ
ncbi:helix-turn-helix domain-containing protein [Edaphobacter modestus]|uniref:Excisionase family DNA binding protein n=1 Tax=Edaphobacter modestus TaxID=388466 RepID=A0A4Q7Z1E6_9BACT|nr:helix-turn-helix domain-containing protein [Edaphobacter modestus]RZU43461.1 excisionase family DNA binding protein [Edaphobacter modestus]